MEKHEFTDEDNALFEEIWVDYNVGRRTLSIEPKRVIRYKKDDLDDDQYIRYKQWGKINEKEMYKKHLPGVNVSIGENPNVIFHGGCLGCKSHRLHGVERCKGCCYFRFDMKKDSLYIEGEKCARMTSDEVNAVLSESLEEDDIVKELRLGNKFDNEGVTCHVIGITKDWAVFAYFEDSIGFQRSFKNDNCPKPIPLTEEWLIKFSLKNSIRTYMGEMNIIIDDNGYRVGLIVNGVKITIFTGRYVHTFQNQWHLLTHEELTIN